MDPGSGRGRKGSRISLNKLSFANGIVSVAILSLSVSVDYWLYTCELMLPPNNVNETAAAVAPSGGGGVALVTSPYHVKNTGNEKINVSVHSGLWRACVYYPEDGNFSQIIVEEDLPLPNACSSIGYFSQNWERPEGGDTTNSILRAIRNAAVPLVGSLLLLMPAVVLGVFRVCKERNQMLLCTGFYVFSVTGIYSFFLLRSVTALCLAVGMIIYISSVNDEISHRIASAETSSAGGGGSGAAAAASSSSSSTSSSAGFTYRYGWAFYFAGLSFIASMAAAISSSSASVKIQKRLAEMSAESAAEDAMHVSRRSAVEAASLAVYAVRNHLGATGTGRNKCYYHSCPLLPLVHDSNPNICTATTTEDHAKSIVTSV